jgi:hypothetical protein
VTLELRDAGFIQAYALRGGMDAWGLNGQVSRAGLEVRRLGVE